MRAGLENECGTPVRTSTGREVLCVLSPDSLEAGQPAAVPEAARAPATNLKPVPPPAACAKSSVQTTRTMKCVTSKWGIDIYEKSKSGTRLIGRASGLIVSFIYMSTKESGVVNQTSITMTAKSGRVNAVVTGAMECVGRCEGARGRLGTNKLVLNKPVTAIGEVAPENARGKRANTSTMWRFAFTNVNPVSTTGILNGRMLRARCDNWYSGAAGKGCAVPDHRPTIRYSLSGPWPTYARHVNLAIKSGLEGSPATGPLTRTRNTERIDANRAKACPRSLKRPKGYDCDEYPMASTNQGAAAGGKARVFGGCKLKQAKGDGRSGFSRCMIPRKHNQEAGVALAKFYGANRVHDGDAFYVRIVK